MMKRLLLAVTAVFTFGVGTWACGPPPPLPTPVGEMSWEGEIPLTTTVFVNGQPVGSCTVHLWTHWDLYYRYARALTKSHIFTPSNCTNNDWKFKSAQAECWIGPASLGGLFCGLENINAGTSVTEQHLDFVLTPTHANIYVTFHAQLILPSGLVLPAGTATGKTPEIMCWSQIEECRFQV